MIEGHGDDIFNYDSIKMNFSSNTNCYADHAPLEQHLKTVLSKAISSYPEPQPVRLETLIAEHSGISSEEVCVTSGATEAIYLIAQTFKGCKSAIPQPTFSEYADACRIHSHIISTEIVPSTELIWLCNPNNPTGKVIPKEQLTETISNSKGTLFVIDQSYEDFTLKPLLTDKEATSLGKVLLIHSMTKRYAIPGLRLGYIVANKELISRVRTQRMPWSVNSLAIEAGLFLINNSYPVGADRVSARPLPSPNRTSPVGMGRRPHPTTAVPNLIPLLNESHRLQTELNKIPNIETFPTDTHFFLARIKNAKASDLKQYLAKRHGILIRDASNFPTLDQSYFRIAARTPQENDSLIEAIKTFVNS